MGRGTGSRTLDAPALEWDDEELDGERRDDGDHERRDELAAQRHHVHVEH